MPTEVTPNRLVAYNMQRARKAAGMTQAELGLELERLTGARWSVATVSAAERSWETDRVREFSANDIVALSCALDEPILGFLLPPDEIDGDEVLVFGGEARGDYVLLLDRLFPEIEDPAFGNRVHSLLDEIAGRPAGSAPVMKKTEIWARRLRTLADEMEKGR